jgi:ribosomal-protein-alanine N-acetyltransferase
LKKRIGSGVNMENLKVCKMSLEDVDRVYDIELACFPHPWAREAFVKDMTENKMALYYVLKLDSKIIGYCGMWVVLDEGHITNIAIHPDYRGRGYGNMLMKSVISNVEKVGIKAITLEVRVSNKRAISLYDKLGFVSSGIRPGYYTDNHEDAMIMWKNI